MRRKFHTEQKFVHLGVVFIVDDGNYDKNIVVTVL